jgi:FtsZ-interacting cell division protein ZipA
MSFIEILVIIGAVAIVALVLGNHIYKRIKHKPTGECACCATRMKKTLNKGIASINKEFQNK